MNGLELIKHTAGGGVMTATTTGGSVKLLKNGKIEFTNATKIHIDKCFHVPDDPGDEPLYDNYLIVIRYADTNNQTLQVRMRAGGSDNFTASSYVAQRIRAFDKTADGDRLTSDSMIAGAGQRSTSQSGTHLYMYGPALKQPTAMRSVHVSDQDDAYIYDNAGTHNQSTAYDGFTIFPGDQSVDGALTIYGFTKGGITK